ncbi:MAG: DegT/DnrJ/EryC1/StrS family aminotransferase [Agromyces sp.]
MTERIHLSPPDVGELEEQYVLAALRSGWVAPLGPDVDAFEDEIAARVGVNHAVALGSGTAALHLGLLALGASAGDVVITSTMTFVATANAIVYTGAEPFFVDSDPSTGNMDPALLWDALTTLHAEGRRVAAIVPVDLLGRCADYTLIEAMAAEFDVPVLADAAESLGAAHRGRPAGSFGRASVFSFNGNKIMTTSGGGMLTTDDQSLAARVRSLSTQARKPAIHYEHAEVGYNYRLSNVLAALGRAQLARLDAMIDRRQAIRDRYREKVAGVDGVELFAGTDDGEANHWLTAVVVDMERTGWAPEDLRAAFDRADIESRPLWKPMHLQPVFAACRAIVSGSSERLFRRGLTLPSGSSLDDDELSRILAVIDEVVER